MRFGVLGPVEVLTDDGVQVPLGSGRERLVLAMLVLAVHARLPVAALRTMIYAYPTFHRGVLDALADLDS